MTMIIITRQLLSRKLLLVALTAIALTLSACDKKDDSTIEGSALELDSQTSEQEAAAEIARANPMASDDIESAILPSEDMDKGTDAIAENGAGQGDVATAE